MEQHIIYIIDWWKFKVKTYCGRAVCYLPWLQCESVGWEYWKETLSVDIGQGSERNWPSRSICWKCHLCVYKWWRIPQFQKIHEDVEDGDKICHWDLQIVWAWAISRKTWRSKMKGLSHEALSCCYATIHKVVCLLYVMLSSQGLQIHEMSPVDADLSLVLFVMSMTNLLTMVR